MFNHLLLSILTASLRYIKNSVSPVIVFSCPRSSFLLLFLPTPALSHSYSSLLICFSALMCLLHRLHWPRSAPLALSLLRSSVYLHTVYSPCSTSLSLALFVVSPQTFSLRWCQDRLNSSRIMFTQGDTGRNVFLVCCDLTRLSMALFK